MGRIEHPKKLETSLTETSQIVIGDLILDFTTTFDWTWDDKGSGAHMDASTWRPKASADQVNFYPLGDMMLQNYDNPTGVHVGILVKDNGPASNPALKAPTDFRYVWSSQMWMAVAPDGYAALGGAAQGGGPPSVDLYRCVRKDLVQQALVGGELYNDSGSGKRDDLSCWDIMPATARAGSIDFSPGTFMPMPNYDTPPPAGFWAFEIAMGDIPPATPPAPPTLTSKNPPPNTGNAVRYVVQLPWFSVTDPGLSDPDRIVKSPIYTMVRTDEYVLAQFKNNNTSIPQSQSFAWTEGISSESVKTFANSVGVELGMEWSIVPEVFKVTAKLSYNFTYTTSSSQGMQSSQSMTDSLTAPPYTAVAVYVIQSGYDIFRQDGTRIQTVTPTFGVPNSTYDTQYPQTAIAS